VKGSFFKTISGGKDIECLLCHHHCRISPSKTGICGVRKNESGLISPVYYGKICAMNLDPIEKKPLYHFYPGSMTFSIALPGCNMHCPFCQNWQISQLKENINFNIVEFSPHQIIDKAREYGSEIISYTYTEPMVSYEFVLDCMKLASKNNMKNVLISNGSFSKDAIRELSGFLDAANIDLKCFTQEGYKFLGGDLSSVLNCIQELFAADVWIEVTTLIVPGFNDSKDELLEIASFISGVSPDIPWHISAFYPTYRMLDRPPTSIQSLITAQAIGREKGLNYIYLGNVNKEGNTFCPKCGKMLVRRLGFSITEDYLTITGGYCPKCEYMVAGRW